LDFSGPEIAFRETGSNQSQLFESLPHTLEKERTYDERVGIQLNTIEIYNYAISHPERRNPTHLYEVTIVCLEETVDEKVSIQFNPIKTQFIGTISDPTCDTE